MDTDLRTNSRQRNSSNERQDILSGQKSDEEWATWQGRFGLDEFPVSYPYLRLIYNLLASKGVLKG